MTRLLFVPMSWGRGIGPLIDCISVAKEAAALGCDVAFLCGERHFALASQSGYTVYPNATPPAPPTVDDLFYVDFPLFQGLGEEEWVRRILDSEFAAIESFKPHVIFSWLQFTIGISAKIAGVSTAAVARWTGHPEFTSPLLGGGHFPKSGCTPLFNRILAEYGLPQIDDIWDLDFLRSDLKIVAGTPELEPGLASIPNLHYVGHLVPFGAEDGDLSEDLAEWICGHPTVFFYLSRKQFQPEEYAPIVKEAFDGSEFRAVVAVGFTEACPALPNSTDNVWFERWLPIDAILSRTDIVVSTATRGIAWKAALHGAAQIAFPGKDPELDFIGRMIETAGAGIRLPNEAFTSARILNAVRDVLDPTTRASARALGDRLKSLGGPKRAAELLVRLAKGGLTG